MSENAVKFFAGEAIQKGDRIGLCHADGLVYQYQGNLEIVGFAPDDVAKGEIVEPSSKAVLEELLFAPDGMVVELVAVEVDGVIEIAVGLRFYRGRESKANIVLYSDVARDLGKSLLHYANAVDQKNAERAESDGDAT